ncbi:DksA/TraR family C4-type zinc finger protein [Oleiagrimonas sp. C23AA]|uniref:DksA/TraR family C4-type zinc finger protein n=1 Tax=Oleiagrimonas sp. C23AA TaxID=2719047 RepID=UPI001421D103|nr:DksA/TraR family C4-type zinc finger protein [Oleiagrimonas sp. C23AA]NII09431.1 DksA/TraR family C4-type zinc finger protein [Oleiagrimonas sp. C23AA]
MATGWAREGAVQDQIDSTVADGVAAARERMQNRGPSLAFCEECDEPISEARRKAVPGVRLCIQCQEAADRDAQQSGLFNRRGSKDSQLR